MSFPNELLESPFDKTSHVSQDFQSVLGVLRVGRVPGEEVSPRKEGFQRSLGFKTTSVSEDKS